LGFVEEGVWHVGAVACRCSGMQVQWHAGAVACRCTGMQVQWHAGAVDAKHSCLPCSGSFRSMCVCAMLDWTSGSSGGSVCTMLDWTSGSSGESVCYVGLG